MIRNCTHFTQFTQLLLLATLTLLLCVCFVNTGMCIRSIIVVLLDTYSMLCMYDMYQYVITTRDHLVLHKIQKTSKLLDLIKNGP